MSTRAGVVCAFALVLGGCGSNPSSPADTGGSLSVDSGGSPSAKDSGSPAPDGGGSTVSDGGTSQDLDAATNPESHASASVGSDGGFAGDGSTAPARALTGVRVLGEGGFFGTSARELGKVNATEDGFAIAAHYAALPGAPGTDKAGGRVYLFRKSAGIPSKLSDAAEILEPPDLAVQGGFGYALGNPCDLDQDGFLDLPVGSHLHSASALLTATGRAIVFWGDASGTFSATRTTLHTLASGVMAKSDCFGQTVTCGDFDGDGVDDLLATGQNAGPSDTGIGGIFKGRAGVRLAANPDFLIAPAVAANRQYFGAASLFADLDGDGVRDLAVGAWGLLRGPDATFPRTGGFSVFKGGTDWALGPSFQVTPDSKNPTQMGSKMAFFTTALASWLAVTASEYDASGGAVLVYKTDSTLSQGVPVNVLRAPAGMVASDAFATSVAYVPDYFGRDRGALLVGAKFATAGTVASAGAVAVFPLTESGLGFDETASLLAAPQPTAGDGFGSMIEPLGDLDGDGLGDFVVGMPEHLEGDLYTGTQTGGVVFFH